MTGFWSRALLGTAGREAVYKCQHCGTTVDDNAEPCPNCGRRAIARYEIP